MIGSSTSLGGLRGAGDVIKLLAPSGIAISAIVLCEILEGAYGSPNVGAELERVRDSVSPYPVLPVNAEVAEIFAALRPMLERQGGRIGDMDLLIASTALVHGLTLVTRNFKHFERIPGLAIFQTTSS